MTATYVIEIGGWCSKAAPTPNSQKGNIALSFRLTAGGKEIPIFYREILIFDILPGIFLLFQHPP
jgi:hypothetical protein